MLGGFNVFPNIRDIHCARSSFLTPFPLLAKVHTSMENLNVVLNNLKHATSIGCKTWLGCDCK